MRLEVEVSGETSGALAQLSAAEQVAEPPIAAPMAAETCFTSNGLPGLIEMFGYDPLAEGWLFAGWLTRNGSSDGGVPEIVVSFSDGAHLGGKGQILFYPRHDAGNLGTGFIIFVPAPRPMGSSFESLGLKFDGFARQIKLARAVGPLTLAKLSGRLRPIVAAADAGPARDLMARLVDDTPGPDGAGYIDFHGHGVNAGGHFINGWLSRPWPPGEAPDRLLLSFEDGDVWGEAVAVTFPRVKLPERALGVLFFVTCATTDLGPLCGISWRRGNGRVMLRPVNEAPRLAGAELTGGMKAHLALARPDAARDHMSNLLDRRPYTGEDTLDALSPKVLLTVEFAIGCGADGLALVGWMVAKPGEVRRMCLRSGAHETPLDLDQGIRIERPDVVSAFGHHGYDEALCGFIVYLPGAWEPDEKTYIEIETRHGKIGYRNIPPAAHGGMTAIRQLLGVAKVRFGAMQTGFDRVLGPAVEALNASRLARRPVVETIDYGVAPARPKFSVIVPLYGRIDFAEFQMALFSAHVADDIEYIYVLDDPPKRHEARLLFASIHARFQVPFRAVLLDRNVGFAPANNIGLGLARGTYVAYLNSDVFPRTPDWLEQLAARLQADRRLGAVGPLLLHEDGSVQHRGMYYERLPDYGNWYFCQHLDKGLRPDGKSGLHRVLAITGACMVMRRDLALRVGGFDEVYAIGDFEDSDLCLTLSSLGYDVAVDADVRLFHLERKSQAGSGNPWRANLTFYNAWQHERRWATLIAERQAEAMAPHG